jgi:hypothetical protein
VCRAFVLDKWNMCSFHPLLSGARKESIVMDMNRVTPFEAFRSFIEFYPRLGATIAFGTMAVAAKMIPTSGAAKSEAAQISKAPQPVLAPSIISHRKRSTIHKTPRGTVRKKSRSTMRKGSPKTSNRLTVRRRKVA